ncbi:MAG: DDE-type integrase/transposase/recombinase [Chloroflexota bacterium]|nr:DDE-type integrase/transposase/recombinase [Chloroflexota bacterium]
MSRADPAQSEQPVDSDHPALRGRLTRDGHDARGGVVYACAGCGRHATTESVSLVSGHRFPRDVILLAVRYYLQLGAAPERIAGVLADRGIDVSGRTILRWVQKFGPALATEVQRHRRQVGTTWLVDETYVKILGKWHYLYCGIDLDGQVLDCWLSATRANARLHRAGCPNRIRRRSHHSGAGRLVARREHL